MSAPKSSHEKWWRGFKSRHPEVIFRTPENLSKARKNLSEAVIRQWYSDVYSYLADRDMSDILKDETRLFNFDETSIILSAKTGKVLGVSGIKHCFQETSSNEKQCITVLSTIGKTFTMKYNFIYSFDHTEITKNR